MRNKRAVIFSIFLPIATLFLCGLVMSLYYVQEKNVQNSLVSPREILEIRDGLKKYEIAENDWICLAYSISGKDEFKLREDFCDYFMNSKETDVLFKNFVDENWDDQKSFFIKPENRLNFCVANYNFEFDGNKLKVSFNGIRMHDFLNGGNRYKISFPVEFRFKYDHNVLIDLEDC